MSVHMYSVALRVYRDRQSGPSCSGLEVEIARYDGSVSCVDNTSQECYTGTGGVGPGFTKLTKPM